MRRVLLVAIALGGTLAVAQPVSVFREQGSAPRNFANVRVGGQSSTPAHPAICLEAAPIELVSVEACGTGSGFLFRDQAPDFAHFRANLKLMSWQTPIGFVQPRLAVGFAELQVGEDASGFDFTGTGPMGTETAGPEAGLSLRVLTPIVGGVELVTEVNASVAVFAHAPRLVQPQAVTQPTLGLSLGFGF
jgi:hypothetical protein